MDKRFSFDKNVLAYDRRRPRYTPRLFADVLRYAGAAAGSRAIEVGMGTGQATEPFLQAGLCVTALEPGRAMADFSREKFRSRPNLRIECRTFEDYDGQSCCADLIYSATAFHWIPADIGYPKAFRLLKSGGTLALFWNRPCVSEGGLRSDVEKVYRRYPAYFPPPGEDDRCARAEKAMLSCGFVLAESRRYLGARALRTAEYIELLGTYSDHSALPPDVRREFERDIAQAIDGRGGTVPLTDTIDLCLARKP